MEPLIEPALGRQRVRQRGTLSSGPNVSDVAARNVIGLETRPTQAGRSCASGHVPRCTAIAEALSIRKSLSCLVDDDAMTPAKTSEVTRRILLCFHGVRWSLFQGGEFNSPINI